LSDEQTFEDIRQAAVKREFTYVEDDGTKRDCKPSGQYAELLDNLTKAAVEYATSKGMNVSEASSLIDEATEFLPFLFKAFVSPGEQWVFKGILLKHYLWSHRADIPQRIKAHRSGEMGMLFYLPWADLENVTTRYLALPFRARPIDRVASRLSDRERSFCAFA
jgi:hypothetical protein